LIDQTVGQRVAERNSQFQNVHPGVLESQGELAGRLEVRVTGTDIDDEPLLARFLEQDKAFHDAIHARIFEFHVPGFKLQVREQSTRSARDLPISNLLMSAAD